MENSNPNFQMTSPFSWSQSTALIPKEFRFVVGFFSACLSVKGGSMRF